MNESGICGIWIDKEGTVHLSSVSENNERIESTENSRPFFWTSDAIDITSEHAEVSNLEGKGYFSDLVEYNSLEAYSNDIKGRNKNTPTETVRPLEHQFLLSNELRIFKDMLFKDLRRCQLDIETACSVEGSFSDPKRKEDRILAIGLNFEDETHHIVLEEDTDTAEKKLLESFNELILKLDPDTIEGHNIFKFDFDYLKIRSKLHKVKCNWGRFGAQPTFRNSRLRVAERWIDYPRCDIPGRTIVDTYFLIMIYDVSTRDLPSYSLKDVAIYLGVTDSSKDNRTYIEGSKIQDMFSEDRERFLAYLDDDLRETAGITDLLLPTYFAQTQNFAMTLQETILRGTGTKIDLLFLEKYFHEKRSLPVPAEVGRFAGGYSASFETGVYKNILHFDVASLYPSLMLLIDRNPYQDSLGIFIPTLRELKEYRLKYKKLAKETEDETLQREYDARQSSFKILINSFYGYLGFEGARFADGELAAEVTERGRDLLHSLIEEFNKLPCTVLEADTDGIYISSDEDFDNPEALLKKVSHILPEGIELEFGGSYKSMFCYKAKNYALYDGSKVTIRGSALRSRGIEPFLKNLTSHLIKYLLGAESTKPEDIVRELETEISSGKMDINRLVKKEYLSQNPEKYAKSVEEGAKSRRASLEVALKSAKPLKAGDQVAYYITVGEKKRMPDWQVARPLETYDPESQPYNPDYYLKKLKDWQKRYDEFLSMEPEQGELF